MAAYGAAKARLFDAPELKHLIINVGDPFGRECARTRAEGALRAGRVPLTAVWIGAGESGWLADRALYATQVTLDVRGISLQLDGSFGKQAVATRLLGRFNAENCLVVIACLLSLGASLDRGGAGAGRLRAAAGAHGSGRGRGRLQAQSHGRGRLCAHPRCAGQGAGRIARALRGRAVVRVRLRRRPRSRQTRHHGRRGRRTRRSASSSPTTIRAPRIPRPSPRAIVERHQIQAPCASSTTAARRSARRSRKRTPQDVVLIAGKGHEDYQIYGETRRSFSDRREAQRYLGAAA